jgi:hypothetical protein
LGTKSRFSYCLESGSHCCELSAGKSIFPQYNQVFLTLLDRILLGAGWEPVGRTLSQIVGSRWECLVFLLLGAVGEVYFLILLGVVRRQTNPHILGWNFCWVESHVSHIVGTWLEVHDSHIVWSRARIVGSCREENQFSRNIPRNTTRFFLYCWIAYCWEPGWEGHLLLLLGAGGKDTFSNCWEPVGMSGFLTIGSRWGEVYFLILLGVVGRQTHPHIVGG